MENLINKNIGLQNQGYTELESWTIMLTGAQKRLLVAYKLNITAVSDVTKVEVDFIQKQIIRVNAK